MTPFWMEKLSEVIADARKELSVLEREFHIRFHHGRRHNCKATELRISALFHSGPFAITFKLNNRGFISMLLTLKKGQKATANFVGANATNPNCPIEGLTASSQVPTGLKVTVTGNQIEVEALDDFSGDFTLKVTAKSQGGAALPEYDVDFEDSNNEATTFGPDSNGWVVAQDIPAPVTTPAPTSTPGA